MIPFLYDFHGKIIDFCFYDYLYEDRYKRAMKDMRKSIITIDTDLRKFGSVRKGFLNENSVNCWNAGMLISSEA